MAGGGFPSTNAAVPLFPSAGADASHLGHRAHFLRRRSGLRLLRVALRVSVDEEEDSR